MYCFSSSKGLGEIRLLDRPGILTLRDDDSQNYYALLVGLSADQATLRIGELIETVSLPALARRWNGVFTSFWRGPADYRRGIGPGSRGDQVDWLAARLARVNGASAPASDRVYDADMTRQIREFQLAQGLLADGVAGPQTFMRLAALTGVNEPHLHTAVDASSVESRK